MTLNPHEKNNLLSVLDTLRKYIASQPVGSSCLTCVHYRVDMCERWQSFPPASIIPVGCPEYAFSADSPPF